MLNNAKKQISRPRKGQKQRNLKDKTNCKSVNFKSNQAACYEQTTAKKVKNDKTISRLMIEEIPFAQKRIQQRNSQMQENMICEGLSKNQFPFTLNNSLEDNTQEKESDTLIEFMREQVKFEEIYSYQKNYLNNQNEIQSHMIAILFDWLVDVAHSFHFKRETFYLSRNYIERFLHKQPNVSITKFQLIAVAALFIAHKFEEIYPKTIKEFHRLIQDLHTIQDIEEMEVTILKCFDFRMNPNTPIFWLNYYTKLWDEFIIDKQLNASLKERTTESYYRYRELVQLFDVCLIDYRFKKNEKLTALSLIYLVIAKSLQIFEDYRTLATSQSKIKQFFNSDHEYNQIFRQFIEQSDLYLHFDQKIEYEDLKDVVYETTQYFILRFDNTLPRVLVNNQDFIDELQHEEFLSFQTYNRNTIETINFLLTQQQ
ncbi:unnamed protein product (macronuclear) [Paramecium tetraurelia]|uniref:Cyclin-like domain-containing protein n=1 Tax=Paramecium tetraurelia TaxID=5888 RepID=A0DGW6_PARTE|nr:uncharacterized protein GSPATT00002412001 [Paramecium tetraurelia]CAK82283.1 unnamed protein product [Paramecium tetraurelia]|eukprot:XP_001449680.1 hypothetical protein (macronuclear) [Paramecium tetraurelia strain d4-2]